MFFQQPSLGITFWGSEMGRRHYADTSWSPHTGSAIFQHAPFFLFLWQMDANGKNWQWFQTVLRIIGCKLLGCCLLQDGVTPIKEPKSRNWICAFHAVHRASPSTSCFFKCQMIGSYRSPNGQTYIDRTAERAEGRKRYDLSQYRIRSPKPLQTARLSLHSVGGRHTAESARESCAVTQNLMRFIWNSSKGSLTKRLVEIGLVWSRPHLDSSWGTLATGEKILRKSQQTHLPAMILLRPWLCEFGAESPPQYPSCSCAHV